MSEEEPLLADRVARLPDGGIALRLVEREREILRALLEDLSLVVGAPPLPTEPWDADGRRVAGADEWPDDPDRDGEPAADTDPAVDSDDGDTAGDDLDDLDIADIRARLYPSAAPEDPRADEAYRRLVHEDLEAGRRARIAIVEATLDATLIDDEQAEAWLHTLNDLRLVLGTRLAITEDAEFGGVRRRGPRCGGARRLRLHWLARGPVRRRPRGRVAGRGGPLGRDP